MAERTLVERCASVLRQTWSAVGGDFLAMFPRGSCSREDVKEAVLDADRYDGYGRDPEAVAEIRRRLRTCGWKSKEVKEIFDAAFDVRFKRFS